jgi:hypothetical protein
MTSVREPMDPNAHSARTTRRDQPRKPTTRDGFAPPNQQRPDGSPSSRPKKPPFTKVAHDLTEAVLLAKEKAGYGREMKRLVPLPVLEILRADFLPRVDELLSIAKTVEPTPGNQNAIQTLRRVRYNLAGGWERTEARMAIERGKRLAKKTATRAKSAANGRTKRLTTTGKASGKATGYPRLDQLSFGPDHSDYYQDPTNSK